MNATTSYKVRVDFEFRADGGIRAWSPDVPELVLSHVDHRALIADLPVALAAILEAKLGAPVRVEELAPLPGFDGMPSGGGISVPREFAARAA